MCKYFDASDTYRVETTRDTDPLHTLPAGAGLKTGVMKAHITVYELGDEASPTLPTLREFLARHTDPKTDLLSYDMLGTLLTIDPAPLRALPTERATRFERATLALGRRCSTRLSYARVMFTLP